MKFVIEKKEKVKQFAIIFNNLKNLSENINIHFGEDGLYAQGITSCHCSFFELNLCNSWFKEYNCAEECIVGVNCEILFKCISSLEEGQTISFEHPYGGDKIYLNFESGKTVSKYFELPLITIDTENLEVPEVDYDVSNLELNSEQFNKWINQISIFGEEIKFAFTFDSMNLSAKSVGSGKMKVKMEIEEDEERDLALVFGAEYLKNICHFSKVYNKIELSIGENYPLRARYDLGSWIDKVNINNNCSSDEEEEDGVKAEASWQMENSIIFYVAPKFED